MESILEGLYLFAVLLCMSSARKKEAGVPLCPHPDGSLSYLTENDTKVPSTKFEFVAPLVQLFLCVYSLMPIYPWANRNVLIYVVSSED